MRQPGRRHSAMATLVAASVGACAPEGRPLPELTWVGEHVEVGASVELSETCAGSLLYADAYVGALRERFGTETDARAEIYWLPDGAELYQGCDAVGHDVRGCAIGLAAFHEYMPAEHEYVHVAWPGNYSASLLEEGLATYLGDDADRDWGPWSERSAWAAFQETDESGSLPGEYYGTAANYVSYLADRFGIGPVLDLIVATDYGESSEEIDAKMRQLLGATLDETLTLQRAEGFECNPFHARDSTISCDLAKRDIIPCDDVDGGWELARGIRMEARVACGDDGVVGPKLGEIWESYVFEVPEAGEYDVSVRALGPSELPADFGDFGTATLEECGGGCRRFMSPIGLSVGGTTTFELQPGSYRVRLGRWVDAPSEVDGVEVEIHATTEETFRALCAENLGSTE